MKQGLSKTAVVRDVLLKGGTISSLEAINLCSATRLSAIIFNLRKSGLNIQSDQIKHIDMFGHECTYSRYYIPEFKKR